MMRNIKLVACLFLFCILALSQSSCQSYNAWRFKSRAVREMYRGDYDKGIKFLTYAIHNSPDDFENYFYRGLAYDMKDQYPAAIENYSKAISINPDYISAYSCRSIVYIIIADYDAAIADCEKIMALAAATPNLLKVEDLASVYYMRGKIYEEVFGDLELAKNDYAVAKELNPEISLSKSLKDATSKRTRE